MSIYYLLYKTPNKHLCLSVVQLGTHHLSFRAPLLVGSDPEDFVRLLHTSYDVQFMEHVAGGRSPRDQNPLAKVTFVHLTFSVRLFDLFVASLVFVKCTSCRATRRNFK